MERDAIAIVAAELVLPARLERAVVLVGAVWAVCVTITDPSSRDAIHASQTHELILCALKYIRSVRFRTIFFVHPVTAVHVAITHVMCIDALIIPTAEGFFGRAGDRRTVITFIRTIHAVLYAVTHPTLLDALSVSTLGLVGKAEDMSAIIFV